MKTVFLLWPLDALLLASLIFAPVLWLATSLTLPLFEPPVIITWSKGVFFLPFVVLVALIVLVRHLRTRGSRPSSPSSSALYQRFCLAIGSTFVLLVGFEQVLQFVGYSRAFPPLVVAEGANAVPSKADKEVFIPDPVLLWRFNPGVEWNGRRINRLGFSDREVEVTKKPGTVRVISFGDSCTGQGGYPYSRVLNDRLTAKPLTAKLWESFNMGVHGYSVWQGLLLYRTRGVALAPDMVTILFGWNDHWLSAGLPDSILSSSSIARRPLAAEFLGLLYRKRFGQMLVETFGRPEATYRPPQDPSRVVYRVPPAEYRDLLTTFVREVRHNGSVPVLMTAPRSEKIRVPKKNVVSLDAAVVVHDEYLNIVREVARTENIFLIDLERTLGRTPRFFSKDGVHFTQDGIVMVAETIYEGLRTLTASEEWRAHEAAAGIR